MTTVNIPMPNSMKELREDQKRAAKIAKMQKLVDEGLASGVSDETMENILKSLQNA